MYLIKLFGIEFTVNNWGVAKRMHRLFGCAVYSVCSHKVLLVAVK